MRLPLELMIHICNMVAEESDITTLKSCAILCSHLTSHCQSHIFAQIDLHLRGKFTEYKLRLLGELLRARPELGEHVKVLHLEVWGADYFDDVDLRSILASCAKVCVFKLMSAGEGSKILPNAAIRVLEPVIFSPFLTEILMIGSGIPPATSFARCHDSLTHLDLEDAVYARTKMPNVTFKGAKVKFLRRLKAKFPTAWLLLQFKQEDGQAIFDLSQLREMSIVGAKGGLDSMQRLNTILRYAARLERLSLQMNLGVNESFTELLNTPLPCFITLRSINLQLDIQGGPSHRSLPPFRGLIDELRRFPSHNVLEDVEISMEVIHHEKWSVVARDWLLLATVFTNVSFHCLKTVNIRTLIAVDEEWSYGIAAEIARLPFGRLKLHYDFSFTLDHDDELVQIRCRKSK